MIILQARANLKKEDIEEQEQKIREKTGEDCIVIPYHMDVIDLKFHPWKEKQMKEYIEKIKTRKIRKRVNLPGGIGRSWLRNFLKGFIIHRHG